MSLRLHRAGADLVYLTAGLATSVLALVAWVAGLSVSLSLAVFVVGIPAFVASALAFRVIADLDRRNAARVLGRPLRGAYRPHGVGLGARVRATVLDRQTWRDLVWLVVHSVLGFAFGTAAVSAVATTVGVAVLPLWAWSLPDGADVGLWDIDTFGAALATAPLALPLGVLTVVLLRGMALVEANLAAALLAPSTRAADPDAPRPPVSRPDLDAGLFAHAATAAIAGFTCTLVWWLVDRNASWPVWVWLGLAITVSLHVLVVRGIRAVGDPVRAFRVRVELCVLIGLVCLAVWALAGGGYFWPIWPLIGMTAGLAGVGVWVFRRRLPWVRERALVERVDELTRTRRGALDVQAAELRRIERDLHDGAQARLVSLTMLLGRAEERLDDRPEVAALMRRAREEAGAAIAELRDLARGIAPPVLADRGLAAAVQGLATRVPMDVSVRAADLPRLPPVVETAAYFVVAEALTNAAKHGGGAPAHVTLARRADVLLVEVADEGPGGADPAGSGLTGLRRRVEALDGILTVDAPAGGGTRIRAELPCGS